MRCFDMPRADQLFCMPKDNQLDVLVCTNVQLFCMPRANQWDVLICPVMLIFLYT